MAASINVWGPIIVVLYVVLSNIVCYLCNENSMLFRAMPHPIRAIIWRTAFFKSNRSRDGSRDTRPQTFWGFDILSPNDAVESWCLPLPGQIALHTFALFYFVLAMVIENQVDYNIYGPATEPPAPDWLWLTYFTHWCFLLLGFAAFLGLINTSRVYLQQMNLERSMAESRQQGAGSAYKYGGKLRSPVGQVVHARATLDLKWDALSIARCLIMEIAVSSTLFVAVFYWVGLVVIEKETSVGIGAKMMHGGNVGIGLLEVLLTRMPFVSYHYMAALLWGSAYTVLVWIYGSVSGVWMYEMNWATGRGIGIYIVLPFLYLLSFAIWTFIAYLRELIAPRLCCHRHYVGQKGTSPVPAGIAMQPMDPPADMSIDIEAAPGHNAPMRL